MLLWNKYEYQHFDIFVKNIYNPFHAPGLSPVPWNVLRVIQYSVIYCVTYLSTVTEDSLYNWKASYKMRLLIFNFPQLINTCGKFISCNVDKIVFILFKTSSDFFFQFEAFIYIAFMHNFFFDFVLDVLIVAYAPWVCLSEVKVNIHLLFFVNQLLFCSWINRCILFR